jgi:hypothetical protein
MKKVIIASSQKEVELRMKELKKICYEKKGAIRKIIDSYICYAIPIKNREKREPQKRITKDIVLKECEYCNTEFTAQNKKTKYCSRKCKDAWNKYKDKKTEKKKCSLCAREFIPIRQNSSFCCQEHKNAYYNLQKKLKREAKRLLNAIEGAAK